MPDTPEWTLVVDCRNVLGEGPSWDPAGGTLLWVDIRGRLVQRLDPASGRVAVRHLDQAVSAVVPRRAGGLAMALEDGIWVTESDFDAGDDLDPARGDGRPRRPVPIEADDPSTRLNDGKCDRGGRLWIGSMAHDARPGAGALYRVDPGAPAVRVIRDLTISNGIGWSPDDRRMYFIDSETRRVDVLDYDVATGGATGRRGLIQVPDGAGLPDGMTVDAEGCLWVALWDGWGLHRYTPSGSLDRVVRLPVARVTSCAFGGPDLTDLYVTSARDGLSDAELEMQPLAGGLFVVRPGVAGLPATPFGG